MITCNIGTAAEKLQSFSSSGPAAALSPQDRKNLSVQVLARFQPVSDLAEQHGVSRKFLYHQAATAATALDRAFTAVPDDRRVLFNLPVTPDWLKQFTLAMVLCGHSSFRGVGEILSDVFDYHDLSVGTIHNWVQQAVAKAQVLNADQDISAVRVGAHDEIYQAGRPVLVGLDVRSLYCYLLAEEQHADETTWGVHLLDLEARGLGPDYTVADGGRGLRAGQTAAWGSRIPCHGDVFHAERDLGAVAYFLENRAAGCVQTRKKLERKMERRKKHRRGKTLSKRLAAARRAEVTSVELARDIRLLSDWIQGDILALAGPDRATRRELYDFVIEELRRREPLCPHRIEPIRKKLQDQRENLLAFAGVLDDRFAELAERFNVRPNLVHQVAELQGFDANRPTYWQREGVLRKRLGNLLDPLRQAVREIQATTPRASSLVENLNSRLRNYFFLRRHIGHGYLDLLRFFLNHRRFARSEVPERTGKTPAELLTGNPHPHWLELLGFNRFQRN
jgi:hypothetical protein